MIVAIVQARMGSTRLPNKTFADLSGQPLIWHVMNRLWWSASIQRVVLATTTNPLDDLLHDWALREGILVHRGSEEDVLARFHGAAHLAGAETIVRITADDPFKDPVVIDRVIDLQRAEGLAFAYNNKPPTFPEGLDVEVFAMAALDRAHREATLPFDREHVTQYLYKHPELFPQKNLAHGADLSALRWTLDTSSDLQLAEEVYRGLYRPGGIFLMEDILRFLETRPHLKDVNAGVPRSAMYLTRTEEQADDANV